MKIIFLMIVGMFIGCASSNNCVVDSTRCDGNTVQICNASKNWAVIDDCNKLGAINGGIWRCDPGDIELPAACLKVAK